MNKQVNFEKDMERLMEEYFTAWEEATEVLTPFKYRVQLDPKKAKVVYQEGKKLYHVVINGKGTIIQNLEFEFVNPILLTRAELLDYVDGTQGIKDVFGYKGENIKRDREEILEELKEIVDELLQTND